jgi:hypothetical protein
MSKLIKAAESSPKGATRIVNVSSGSPQSSYSPRYVSKKTKLLIMGHSFLLPLE